MKSEENHDPEILLDLMNYAARSSIDGKKISDYCKKKGFPNEDSFALEVMYDFISLVFAPKGRVESITLEELDSLYSEACRDFSEEKKKSKNRFIKSMIRLESDIDYRHKIFELYKRTHQELFAEEK